MALEDAFILPYAAYVVALVLPWLLYVPFAWWDRRKPPERRDAWGPWGVVFAVAVLNLASLASLFTMGFLSVLSGRGSPPSLAFVVLNGSFLSAFVVYAWIARGGYRKRLELGYGGGPGGPVSAES